MSMPGPRAGTPRSSRHQRALPSRTSTPRSRSCAAYSACPQPLCARKVTRWPSATSSSTIQRRRRDPESLSCAGSSGWTMSTERGRAPTRSEEDISQVIGHSSRRLRPSRAAGHTVRRGVLRPSRPMSDAYAAAGVDTDQADAGVGALVGVLRTIETGAPSRSVVPSGHYASVLRVSDDLGIAIATDGVGSKLVVAEEADRLETVGIDCVAMNVNDLVCVGAEPIALVDYLAVEEVNAQRLARIGQGLKVGAEAAGTEVPGGELAVLPELIRGHPSPHGFDLCATAIGTVKLDNLILGDRIAPGDALIGVPSSGLHSNGYTLARRALLEDQAGHPALELNSSPAELGGASVADALLEPT